LLSLVPSCAFSFLEAEETSFNRRAMWLLWILCTTRLKEDTTQFTSLLNNNLCFSNSSFTKNPHFGTEKNVKWHVIQKIVTHFGNVVCHSIIHLRAKNGPITIRIIFWSSHPFFCSKPYVMNSYITHPFSSKTMCNENQHKVI
jgi:hypothetical protein